MRTQGRTARSGVAEKKWVRKNVNILANMHFQPLCRVSSIKSLFNFMSTITREHSSLAEIVNNERKKFVSKLFMNFLVQRSSLQITVAW